MNIEQFEKALTALPKGTRDNSPPPTNTPISNWIETPKSKAIVRYGYNPEQRILAISWITLSGTETYLYENTGSYIFEEAQKAYSIGKYLKSAVKYKRFTKVV